MTSPLVDVAGHHSHPDRRGARVKQVVFDWSGIVAIVGGVMWLATMASTVSASKAEIERLRVRDDQRAAEMATRSDVEKVSDKLDALATEMRAAVAARDRTINPR